MAETPERAPIEMARSFLADIPTASLNVGMALMSRRTNAVAEFWRSFAEVRQPTELMAVQLGFWRQMFEDYREALSEGMSQLGGGQPEPTARPAPPGEASRAA